MEEKIHFANVSKLKHPIPLKIVVQHASTIQAYTDEDSKKQDRLDKIDEYFLQRDVIARSMMGTGQKGYQAKVILAIHTLIFGKPKGSATIRKNKMIEEILDYYKNSYVPRVGAVANNTYIDMSSSTSNDTGANVPNILAISNSTASANPGISSKPIDSSNGGSLDDDEYDYDDDIGEF